MQIYADVTGCRSIVIGSEQGPAAGLGDPRGGGGRRPTPTSDAAAAAMGSVHGAVYVPDEDAPAAYDALFAEYRRCTTTSAGAATT